MDDSIVRIFVGCSANNEDLEMQAVCEYSLRKRATKPLDIVWMQLSRDPKSFWHSDLSQGWQTKTWRTPFTALRWGIPEFCKFEGRAIYMDSDIICLEDPYELWRQDIPRGKLALSKPGDFCVMLMDCAAMKNFLPPVAYIRANPESYKTIQRMLAGKADRGAAEGGSDLTSRFKGNWNCRDRGELENYKSLEDPSIKLIHYTHIPTQPSHKHAMKRLEKEGGGEHWYKKKPKKHPIPALVELFEKSLAEATSSGYPLDRYRVTRFGDYMR